MKVEDLGAELEADLSWRLDELRRLKNQLYKSSETSDLKAFRKALVVMLYSHFEGYFKTASTAYVNAINKQGLACQDATTQIVASAFDAIFKAYDDRDRKNKIFKTQLPEDERLHRFSRRVDLLDGLNDFMKKSALIAADDVIDLNSNLAPSVIRKVLFQVGLPHDAFDKYVGKVHWLVNCRNDVAHGSRKEGFEDRAYTDIEDFVRDMMQQYKALLLKAFATGVYKRDAA